MPSTRTLVRASAAAAALGFVGTVAAQSPGGSGLELGARLGIRLVVSLVVYLLLGGALVALGPRYATETSREIREDPGSAFVWGLLVSIGVPFVLVLLAFTIIGLIVAIPGLLLLFPVGVVGTAVTVVTVGAAIRGSRGDVSGTDAAVGALALAVPFAIPVIGDLVTTVATLFGTGIVGRFLYESWRG
ncbi:hypothetical protein HUG10_05135 [Halorarum halophilum]|uniref:DUF8173 domain-containing protein n=1 Tax=Halorarum halophilum TaxID=2743090 RepID=A0A7D5K0J9_9EURY|nr:hypothetical protein [Halobaculum halophilum]QLG26961.1 hypothetical protein HUG10_05135 [Halobaculum halophilum]